MVANRVVSQVARPAIESPLTRAIRTDSIIAEVEPDVLTAVVRGGSIIPAHLCKINLRTVPIMADFLSSFFHLVTYFSKAFHVELMLFVDKATFVARVVDDCLKTTDIGVKDIRYDGLSHSLFFLYSLLIYL